MTPAIPRFATITSLLAHEKYQACSDFNLRRNSKLKEAGSAIWHSEESVGLNARALVGTAIRGMSAEQLVDEHSNFTLFAQLLPPSQRNFWRKAISVGAPMAAALIRDCRHVGLLQGGSRAYCPQCVAEDLAARDTSFWRTYHQLPFVRNCVVHGCALRTACTDCGTPFSRSLWRRQPSDSCETCLSTNVLDNRRPELSPGLHDMELLVSCVLFDGLELDHQWARNVTVGSLVRSWNCGSEQDLYSRLGVRERPRISMLYGKTIGDEPFALRLAKMAFHLGACGSRTPRLVSTSDTWLTRRNEARRRCPSWVRPTHLKGVPTPEDVAAGPNQSY